MFNSRGSSGVYTVDVEVGLIPQLRLLTVLILLDRQD